MKLKTSRLFGDGDIIRAALEGLELQKARIEAQVEEVKTMFGEKRSAIMSSVRAAKRTRELFAAGRARIAAAQKRRWAEYRKKQAIKK